MRVEPDSSGYTITTLDPDIRMFPWHGIPGIPAGVNFQLQYLSASSPLEMQLFSERGAELFDQSLAQSENQDEAFGVLQDYSLVRRNHAGKTLSIHRLVQAVLQDEMEETERQHRAKRVVLAI